MQLFLKNQVFGDLTVESEAVGHQDKTQTGVFWNCVCTCGKTRIVRGALLTARQVTNCGCKNHLTKYPIIGGCKQCTMCKKMVPIALFSKSTRKDKLQRKCKECCAEYQIGYKESASKNSRVSHLKRRFNITVDDYNRILDSQQGLCAICGSPPPPPGKRSFSVDHNHETNANRGILCQRCNTLIGMAREQKYVLESAIQYLEKHNSA